MKIGLESLAREADEYYLFYSARLLNSGCSEIQWQVLDALMRISCIAVLDLSSESVVAP